MSEQELIQLLLDQLKQLVENFRRSGHEVAVSEVSYEVTSSCVLDHMRGRELEKRKVIAIRVKRGRRRDLLMIAKPRLVQFLTEYSAVLTPESYAEFHIDLDKSKGGNPAWHKMYMHLDYKRQEFELVVDVENMEILYYADTNTIRITVSPRR